MGTLNLYHLVIGTLYKVENTIALWNEPHIAVGGIPVDLIQKNETVLFLGEIGGEDPYEKPQYARFLTSGGVGWIHRIGIVNFVTDLV